MKKAMITFGDFNKLDIRVGEIKDAAMLEGSKNLIKMNVDMGDDYGMVEILSGLARWYKPEEIKGKKYAFLANLEPKLIMGKASNGMIFVSDDSEKPILLQVGANLKNGTVIR